MPGPAYSGHNGGMSTLPYVAYVGVGNAANSSAYCLRTAVSMAAAWSTPASAHSRRPNSRASAKRRAVRSSTIRSAFASPNRSGKMPRAWSA